MYAMRINLFILETIENKGFAMNPGNLKSNLKKDVNMIKNAYGTMGFNFVDVDVKIEKLSDNRVNLIFFVDKWVKYNDTILGSDGSDVNPFWVQNNPKSLKSDLYALIVLLALELCKFNKVSSWRAFISVIILFIHITIDNH